MNKVISGILAIGIYFALIFLILLYYNVHNRKPRHYVEKNENRVTVLLSNSNKTALNRSSKLTLPKKPVPQHHAISKPIPIPKRQTHPKAHTTPKKHTVPKKSDAKRLKKLQDARRAKERAKKLRERKKQARLARIQAEKEKKEQERLARIKAEREKKERERLARIKAEREKKERERLARIKAEKKKKERERLAQIKAEKKKKERERLAQIKAEKEKKERERLARIKAEKKKKEQERLARIKAEEERKKRRRERSRNLFSSVNTHSRPQKEPTQSRVKHTSRAVDRIKNTHQSGRVSSRNRDRGVVNAYIARVQRQLNNWNAQSNYKGQSATIRLTINSSGHFTYRVRRSTSMALSSGLKRFLKQLNRIGLGRHRKSTPYIIEVTFRAR